MRREGGEGTIWAAAIGTILATITLVSSCALFVRASLVTLLGDSQCWNARHLAQIPFLSPSISQICSCSSPSATEMDSLMPVRKGNRGRMCGGSRCSRCTQKLRPTGISDLPDSQEGGLRRLRRRLRLPEGIQGANQAKGRVVEEEERSSSREKRIESFAPEKFHGSFSTSSMQEIVSRMGDSEKQLMDSMGLRG